MATMKRAVFCVFVFLLGVSFLAAPSAADGHLAENATGDGVKVGVIDTHFDTDSVISDNIADSKSFSDTSDLDKAGSHGTRVAEAVVQEAPEAELYLAAGGEDLANENTLENITDWMTANNVDVVVISIGYFGEPYDGTSPISGYMEEMDSNGTIVVAAAGNQGQRHWQGTTELNSSDYVVWNSTSNDTQNSIVNPGGFGTMYISRYDHGEPAGVYELQQNGSTITTVDLDTSTHMKINENDGFDPSSPFSLQAVTGTTSGEHIQVHVTKQSQLDHYEANGSVVTPASDEVVISVGAHFPDSASESKRGTIRPYSSRGITPDGRVAVDYVAADGIQFDSGTGSKGTSFAAPRVAGTIAGMISIDPQLDKSHVNSVLEATSEGGGPSNTTYGHGRLNRSAAVTHGQVRVDNIDANNQNITVVASNTRDIRGYRNVTLLVFGDPVKSQVISVNRTSFSVNIPVDYAGNTYGNITVEIGHRKDTIFYESPESGISTSSDITYTLTKYNESAVDSYKGTYMEFTVDKSHIDNPSVTISGLEAGQSYEVYQNDVLINQTTAGVDGTIEVDVDEGATYDVVTSTTGGSSTGNAFTSLPLVEYVSGSIVGPSIALIFAGIGGIGIYYRRRSTSTYSNITWV